MTLKKFSRKLIAFGVAFLLIISVFCINLTASAASTGYINGINVHIRSGPSTATTSLGKYTHIYVELLGSVEGQNATGWGTTWYNIRYGDIVGYVYGEWFTVIETVEPEPEPEPTPTPDVDFETQLLSFPESYRDSLRQLKAAYPNWSFKADELPLTFAEAVAGEDVFPLKLVPAGYSSSWKSMGEKAYNWETGTWYYDAGNWQAASREVIAYYMDPRNFLNANNIYMFAQQSYDSSMQSQSGLEKIVAGTFLANGYSDPNDTAYGGSYINVIMEAARQSGMSPYVIASLILIEHGSSGNGPLISGASGYYNFFNYGASGSTNADVVANGLKKAQELGWNTRSKSIIEGAKRSSNNYISKGQDTYYYMDFDVKSAPYFSFQYAQSIMDALNKGAKMRSYYSENPQAALSFTIPVYKDMPLTAAPAVESSDKLNNYYFTSLSVDGFSMYNKNYSLSVAENTRITYSVPSGAEYVGSSVFELKAGSNTVVLPVKSQTGYINNYTLNISAANDCYLVIGDGPFPLKDGDINADGIVDRYDCDIIYNYLLGIGTLDEESRERADINNDGVVDTLDLGIVTETVSNTTYYGDADNNKAVDANDLICLRKYILGIITLPQVSLCDVNSDGIVNVKDLVRLERYMAGQDVTLG